MSKRVADKINKDVKQPKLADFIKSKSKSTETQTATGIFHCAGMKNKSKIVVNVHVNVKTRIGKKDTKTIHVVSAVPETQSSPLTTEAHATTSAAVFAEGGTSDSSLVNVTLNVTAEIEVAGKQMLNFVNYFYSNIEFILNLYSIDSVTTAAAAEIVPNVPADITPYGTLKNIEPQMLQLSAGYKFPVTDKRKFNPKYLKEYVWLEYSVSKDATFCYACRQFAPTHDRGNVFKHTGFSHWKSAAESSKGFKRHQDSGAHVSSMAKWAEALNRQKSNTSVVEIVSGNVLQYRRNYVKKILEVLLLMNNSMIRLSNNISFEILIFKKYLFRLLYF